MSIEGVKRPRGRPPLPETLKRRMTQQSEIAHSSVESTKPPSSTTNVDKPHAAQTPVKLTANLPAASSPEPSPVVVKKRRKQGLRGMARLLVSRPGSKVNGLTKSEHRSPPITAGLSQPKHQPTESSDKPVTADVRCEQPMEVVADQAMPSLSSPIWQPASKRVLDAVCVTDVTACSGVTITVRESSVVDGFFRSRPEEP